MEPTIKPMIHAIVEPSTGTITYVIYERPGSACVVIDSVLDYDPKSSRTSTQSADQVIDFIRAEQLQLTWILETHVHADHLSACAYLKEKLGGRIAIGANTPLVQAHFKKVFNLEASFKTDGSQFDRLLSDSEHLPFGNLSIEVFDAPGHTPACVVYKIGDAVFVGDTLFMPDVGTARCDFPGGSAKTLYASIRKILSLPLSTRLFMCHDYSSDKRALAFESSVAKQRAHNIHIHDGITEQQFVQTRTARDATLEMPVLILAAVQINIRAGNMPPKENNGTAYLKIPLNSL